MAAPQRFSRIRQTDSRFDLDRIHAIPIHSVAADLGFSLNARGTGLCRLPGHEDHNPSFSAKSTTNRFACYACGCKGDVIDLVMIMGGLDFKRACGWLSEKYLGEISRLPSHVTRTLAIARSVGAAPRPRTFAKSIGAPDDEVYSWILEHSPLNETGKAYLQTRGFMPPTTQTFRIGQIGNRTALLGDAVREFGRQRLRACGLINKGQFGERLVFPSNYLLFPFVADGAVIYLQARRSDQSPQWRWLCLDSLLPPVFNLDALSSNASTISICEGVTDVVSAHELGLNAIGLVGANGHLDKVTVQRLRGRNVAIYGDADSAGTRFARGLVEMLAGHGITAIPKRLPPDANDLNDHLRKTRGLA